MDQERNLFKDYISKPEINLFLSILIPLVALAVSWGIFTARLDHTERMINGLQDTYKQQNQINQDIQIKLTQIQTDVLWIRKGLDQDLRN